MDKYIRFLEDHLGEIQHGWSKDYQGNALPFQIVKYTSGPYPETVTYSTLGISKEVLVSPTSKKEIRQEIVFVSYSKFGDKNIPGILQQVGLEVLESKTALLRGDVIGPYGKMFQQSNLEALYVSMPVYFPESFKTFEQDDNIPIVQTWLFPITVNEAKFINDAGWNKFEDILEDLDPDLLDFERKSIL